MLMEFIFLSDVSILRLQKSPSEFINSSDFPILYIVERQKSVHFFFLTFFSVGCKIMVESERMKRYLILLIIFLFPTCRSNINRTSINIGFMGGLVTLDPDMRSEVVTNSVNSNIFEPLVTTGQDMSIKPLLARSWENPNSKTWVFKLRKGVVFHNGDSLTAEDVKFSLLRARDHPLSELKGYLLKIKNINILNKNTVQIITSEPDFPFLNKLTAIPILSKRYTESKTFDYLSTHPVGTGPYKLTKCEEDKCVELTRNEHYWGKRPEIETVIFHFYKDLNKAIVDLINNKIAILDNCPLDNVDKIENNKDIELVSMPGLAVTYLGLNMDSSLLKDLRVRKAINLGINRKMLVDSIRMGFADEATQLLNSGVYGYNPFIKPAVYNTTEARRLLKEAGYENGFTMRLLYFSVRKRLGQIIRDELEKIGINVVLVPVDAKELFRNVKAGQFDCFVAYTVSKSGDAEEVFLDMVHSKDTKKGYGLLNHSRFSNKKIDVMIESLGSLSTSIERLKMMERIIVRVTDKLPYIPLYIPHDLYAKRKEVIWHPRLDRTIKVADISFAERVEK